MIRQSCFDNQLLKGVLDSLQVVGVGSRKPTKYPTWVTLEVAHGGFATGEPVAKLSEGENNRRWLGREGLEKLGELFNSRKYTLSHPEEGALLVYYWLLSEGKAEEAGRLLTELKNCFETLRFYPNESPTPVAASAGGVYITKPADATASIKNLMVYKDSSKLRQKYAKHKTRIHLLQPLEDDLVTHLVRSCGKTTPKRHRDTKKTPFTYSGGVPFTTMGEDWKAELKVILKKCDAVVKDGKVNVSFAMMMKTGWRVVKGDPVGDGNIVEVVKVLAKRVEQLEKNPRLREDQKAQWEVHEKRDMVPVLEVFGGVLAGLPGGVKNWGLTEGDAAALCAKHGFDEHQKIKKILSRCTILPINDHFELGNIPSLDTLANPVQQLVASVQSNNTVGAACGEGISHLYNQLYVAFRSRRSLLLLNYEKQVKIDEIPWIKSLKSNIVSKRKSDGTQRPAFHDLMKELATFIFDKFPEKLIPNKLLQELEAVRKEMGEGEATPRFVEEIAADIFMGGFSTKFTDAGRLAAKMMKGTLYAEYYKINRAYEALENGESDFAMLASFLSGVTSRTCAANGMHIEGGMILTTHNLATLLNLVPPGTVDHSATLTLICKNLDKEYSLPHDRSRMKSFAYGFRQLVFHLSHLPLSEQQSHLSRLTTHENPKLARIYQELSATVNGGSAQGDYIVTAWHFSTPKWW